MCTGDSVSDEGEKMDAGRGICLHEGAPVHRQPQQGLPHPAGDVPGHTPGQVSGIWITSHHLGQFSVSSFFINNIIHTS